eukprot:scaffold818_cov64-Phaeocystis_antarctica.AAC.12
MKPSDGVCSDSAAKARSTGGAASGAHESSRSAKRLDSRPSAAAFISETTANSVRAGGGNIRTGLAFPSAMAPFASLLSAPWLRGVCWAASFVTCITFVRNRFLPTERLELGPFWCTRTS